MSGNKPIFYWDADVFISWLQGDDRTPEEMNGIESVYKLAEYNKATLLVSLLWRIEVLDSTLNTEQKTTLQQALSGKLFAIRPIGEKVIDLAHNIRDFYLKKNPEENQSTLRKIKTPDAIHLASAIIYGAHEFHTFDTKILKLDGNVAGYKLKICHPVYQPLNPTKKTFLF